MSANISCAVFCSRLCTATLLLQFNCKNFMSIIGPPPLIRRIFGGNLSSSPSPPPFRTGILLSGLFGGLFFRPPSHAGLNGFATSSLAFGEPCPSSSVFSCWSIVAFGQFSLPDMCPSRFQNRQYGLFLQPEALCPSSAHW
jgi:hypothetical protein